MIMSTYFQRNFNIWLSFVNISSMSFFKKMNVRSFVTDYSVDYSEPHYASPIYFSKLD